MIGFANQYKERDVFPFEIVEPTSDVSVVIREMAADLDRGFKPRLLVGHCINEDEQVWHIKPDERALPFRIRKNKHGQWKDTNGNVYRLSAQPLRWHQWSQFGSGYSEAGG